MRRYYFFPILSIISFLLILVPVGIYLNNVTLAKISGVFTLLITIISMRFWFHVLRSNSNRNPVVKLSVNDLYSLKRTYSFLKNWSSESHAILQGRISVALSEVRFLVNGVDVSREVAINFSFIIALKYLNEDILPISKYTVSGEALTASIQLLQSKTNLTFEECITICADANIVEVIPNS
ncbi:MAG: hypothetical protein ACKO5W_08630 [Crocinitomicaceae bacterium]